MKTASTASALFLYPVKPGQIKMRIGDYQRLHFRIVAPSLKVRRLRQFDDAMGSLAKARNALPVPL
jgi:hypothetical protein